MRTSSDPWGDLGRRRRAVWLSCVGLVVGGVAAALVVRRLGLRPLEQGQLVGGVCGFFLMLLIMALAKLERFACPRCGKPFVHQGWSHRLFTRACLHCGEPRGGQPGPRP